MSLCPSGTFARGDGVAGGAEEVHRWDPGQRCPCLGFEPVEKEEQLGFMTQATL